MHDPNPDSNYDVLLSSKSGDTDEEPFTSHLYTSLQKAGISVFWDHDGLLSGAEQMSPSVVQVIQRSRISVVVLSEGYAGSRRCLEVLEQIIEWRRNAGQFVLPVFLRTSREDVLFQRSAFGNAFDDLTNRISDKDKVGSWKLAFSRICQIQSYILVELQKDPSCSASVDGNQRWWSDNEVEDVVERAKNLLHRTDLFVAEHLVGLAHHALSLPILLLIGLKPEPEGVLLLGITGMIGIGKTTLAKAIYNRKPGDFEGRSFLPNIREVWEQDKGDVYLQERLLSDVDNLSREKIESIEIGKKMLKEELSNKRILLVLDDVTKLEQLNALCGSREWFGPGSMIIITTRDRSLLREHGVESVHKMKEMDETESLVLFKQYVKEEIIYRQDFHQLSKNLVASNGGLPLALEVSGSKVFGSASDSILDRLAESPDLLVLKVLKSYINNLPDTEKDIFLDMAYFSIGMDRENVMKTFGDLAKKGITALQDKWLVTFDRMNKLRMNVLLRDTGRKIICEQMRENHESWMYDVFLNFRGEGSCATFTSHLCTHLANANINFFKKDDDEIRRGDSISISQLQALRKSSVCVVVLSKHYANSRWCLQELDMIMECHKTIGQMVVPIFYGVDRSAVHNQTGEFGEAFQNLLKTISVESDKEERWRIALREIGNIAAGIEIPADSRNEEEDIKNVIEHVTHSLGIMFVVEHPVGLKARVQDVIQLLVCKKSKEVLLLGIWGMGGSGKTTIAKALYNILSRKHEARSFLQDISEIWKQDNGQLYLQEKLLSDTNNGTKIKIDDVESGKELLIERLCHERILLVLDDVDKLEQLNVLCASRQWFGSDSMIIITTRDKHLLDELGVDYVYRTKEMDESESAILFSVHAFKQPSPREYFEGLSRDAVAYCGGLPLALVELGRELFGKDELEWESLLGKYKRSPHSMIQNVLKSFDDLNDKEKDMFTDIALFFIGMNREEAIQRLNAFGDLDEKGISALEDRFLVTVDMKNKLRMHVLLRNKGREIIREQMRVELPAWIYDVFVSFKGEECATFTSHLCTRLANAKINFIKADDEIRRRDGISISLLQEIGRCRISVIVLSRDYANSRWCLQELEKIIECQKTIGQVVVPVFYGVDPSTVRNQTGQFGEAFQDLLTRFSVESDKENNWRTALWKIGSIAGTVITDPRKEGDENVKNVIEHVIHSLGIMFVVEHPVGLKARVQDVIQLLNCKMSEDVLLLGIWGMGGSGKTTLAKAIYKILSRKYEGRSFLQDISDIWKQDNGRVCLQEKLLSDINNGTAIKIEDVESGKKLLIEGLRHERILLVLDDVDDTEQLNALCGSREWFGSDSIIIITTRDKRLLNKLGVGHVYRMKEMDEIESAMLLSWHAFKQPSPREDFVGLCRDVVAHCGGLPLALEVLGCELFGKDESEWKSLVHRYKRIPHPTIQNVLKRSFDGLGDDRVKNVFLEIACFFVGLDQTEVIQRLIGFGYHLAATCVPVLVEQSLVVVDEMNRLGMHLLLQQMAREIFRQRPGMPSIYDVFFSFSKYMPSSFTSCLIGSLEKAGISVFRDDDSLTGGDHISPSVLRVIQRCRISVVVLSKGYIGSRRCLEALEQIIECSRIAGQFVLPVFFGISPYVLRYLRRGFGGAFNDLTERISDKDKVESWKIALARISSCRHRVSHAMSRYRRYYDEDDKDDEYDKRIKKIVELAKGLLDRADLFVAEYPVGVESHVQEACQPLNRQKEKDVLLLGVWGMAGIGKTTIAKAIYNQIGGNFEGRSFLPNIREVWEQDKRHVYLQERLLSDVYKSPIIKIDSIRIGKKILENKLSHKRVLLVLDGVNKREQLDALCGSRKWFGPGSVIIITTRDKRLLIDRGVDHVHTMKEMDVRESTELFSWHVAELPYPMQHFAELCGNVVSYCGGLPLALYVLGFKVFRILLEMEEWEHVLDGLREFPHPDIQEALRISFDDLNDDKERELFLDISFFYIGINKEDVIVHALKGYGDSVESRITVLEDRSLVEVDENGKFGMHVLLREMGREILCNLVRMEPEPMDYDVFLSFRADTRASFTSHLYTYLQNAGCHVFKDDESLQRGDQISISMMQAIGRSRISIVVLSEKYPNSRWCMIELEKIMECRRTTKQQVLPVFYGVRPSEVLNSGVPSKKRSIFREAFEELLGNTSGDKDRELGWKRALADISAIQGHVIANSWNESKDIKKIVADVTKMLNEKYLPVADHPVGVESRVADVIKLINNHQKKDILVLGIWGMGGAGKTTIAKATYNQIGHEFEGRSFLLDIRKFWKEINAQVSLQKKLLSDVCKEMAIKIDNIEEGKSKLQKMLRQKKILLVLDDVNDQEQLNALCGSSVWFGEGSRIIITTRNKKLVAGVGKGEEKLRAKVRDVGFEIYPLKRMEEGESIELFSWHAFQQASPLEEFHELSLNIVSYSGRLPLALEVLGSYLFGRELDEWTSVLDRLKRIPDDKVQKKLRISYDGLSNAEEKDIFLDIAFFLIGMDRNDAIQILNGCGFSAKIGVSVLVDRSLITVDRDNKLGMHNLLRDMGREIVREIFPKRLEKRSRLCDPNDVLNLLENKMRKGTRRIEGLALKLSENKKIKLSAFRKMRQLRLLQLGGVELDGNFENMSSELRWLCWSRFPSSHTPTEFDQRNLVAIELEYSNLTQPWAETQFLEKLKVLNLSHSRRLTQTPDFSYLPNLEKLLLKNCPSLSAVSETIGDLKNILLINFEKCTRLPNLPRSFYKLKSLATLTISGCTTIDKLEEDVEQMESLITLLADNTGIKQVPFSLVRSKSIGYISLCGYEGFSQDVFPSLIWSWMSPTNVVSFSSVVQSSYMGLELVSFNVPKLPSLWVRCGSSHKQGVKKILDILDAAYCKELEATTTSAVSNLESSSSIDFPCQFHISGSAKFVLIEVGMKSQVTNDLREMILQKLTTSGRDDCLLPSDNYAAWFAFNCDDSCVIFEVPHTDGRILKSMTLCIVYSSSPGTIISECLQTVSIQNYTQQSTTRVYDRDKLASSEDEKWQIIMSNLKPGDKVKIRVVSGDEFIVKKTTVYLIFDEPTDQNMEQQTDVIVSPDNDTVIDGDENTTSRTFDAKTNDLTTSPERSQTSKAAALIQESSHGDQVLQEKTYATDQLPYIDDLKLVSTTHEDKLAHTLKETDNDDDIFAELDKVLHAEAASVDINPAVKFLHECYEIIEGKDLKSLGTNEDLTCKLKDKLTELAPIRSHLPPVFKETATKLERLYKDILDHFIPTSQVLDQHRSLLDSKSKVLEDLSSLKKRKEDLDASTTEINVSLVDVARKRTELEDELKSLVERENKLNFSKEQSKVALNELKQEVSFKLKERKKIFEELPMVEAKAKEAEITQLSLSKQLEDVQQSLKITKA